MNLAQKLIKYNKEIFGKLRRTLLFRIKENEVLLFMISSDKENEILYEKIFTVYKNSSRWSTKIDSEMSRVMSEQNVNQISTRQIFYNENDSTYSVRNVVDYFDGKSFKEMPNEYGVYLKEIEDSELNKIKEQYPMSEKLIIGDEYFLYLSTRGEKTDSNSYVKVKFTEINYNSVNFGGQPEYNFVSAGTLHTIKYNKLSDDFNNGDIITYNNFILEHKMFEEMIDDTEDNLSKTDRLIEVYLKDKSKENLKELDDHNELLLGNYKNNESDEYLKSILKVNNAIPPSHSITINSMFGDLDYYNIKLDKPLIDYVPVKKYSKNKIDYKLNPKDNGLAKIMDNIVSNDYLRPIIMGVNFNKKGVVGTNAHVLLFIAGETDDPFKGGTYPMSKASIKNTYGDINDSKEMDSVNKKKYAQYIKDKINEREPINGIYPQWEQIVPKYSDVDGGFVINVVVLASVLKYLIKNKAISPITYSIILDFKDNNGNEHKISLNAKLLLTMVDSFMMLGAENLKFNMDGTNGEYSLNRAILVKDADADTDTFGIVMPVMMGDINSASRILRIVDKDTIEIGVGDTPKFEVSYSDLVKGAKKTKKLIEKPKKERINIPTNQDLVLEKRANNIYSKLTEEEKLKKFEWLKSMGYSDDSFSGQISRHLISKNDLIHRRTTPRKIIGTGYKGDTRKIAMNWLDEEVVKAMLIIMRINELGGFDKLKDSYKIPKLEITKELVIEKYKLPKEERKAWVNGLDSDVKDDYFDVLLTFEKGELLGLNEELKDIKTVELVKAFDDVNVGSRFTKGDYELVREIEPTDLIPEGQYQIKHKNGKKIVLRKSRFKGFEKDSTNDDDDDFLRSKIEAFKTMLEMEDDKSEVKYLKEKIEAFEMMLDI